MSLCLYYKELAAMLMGFRHLNRKLMMGVFVLSTMVGLPLASQAQSPGDVVRIGNSPNEWGQFESYWNQLINLSRPPAPVAPAADSPNSGTTATATDPKVLEQALIRNLRVSGLSLNPILRLNGSSQVKGSLTNRNSKAVTVTGVNLDVLDSNGALVQTTSAIPQPSTVPAGATVTFTQELLTVPSDGGYTVRISRQNPFSIQGGI
jgi:hypothetical protein